MTVPVVMTTYFEPGEPGLLRAKNALETAITWHTHADIDYVIVADDCSDTVNYTYLINGLSSIFRGAVQTRQSPNPQGVGASLNRGMRTAFGESNVCLYAVDDWRLNSRLDLQPWADILASESDLGCIRLGPPHPNLRGTVRHLPDGPLGEQRPWLLDLDPYGYTVAQRPALWHRRFFEQMGWWQEDVSALDSEQDMNLRWIRQWSTGKYPTIALALPHPWHHADVSELSAIDPKERTVAGPA